MSTSKPVSVLFTGYAHVHFLCFRPLYERLLHLPGVEVWVSGGLRTTADQGYLYDAAAMYTPPSASRRSVSCQSRPSRDGGSTCCSQPISDSSRRVSRSRRAS